jgi:4'-phosphopantetheinyl transferase
VSDDLIEVLSPDERARAERFLKPRDGLLWARAHGVLRVLLGRYLDADAGRLRFAAGKNGKPTLIDDYAGRQSEPGSAAPAPAGLHFNLTQSGHMALYAFTQIGPIGVDVEIARRPFDEIAVAARAFGSPEALRLKRLRGVIRELEFLRMWTRHEAKLKCHGTGIGGGGAEMAGVDICSVELDVGPHGAGAVAVKKAAREICFWEV